MGGLDGPNIFELLLTVIQLRTAYLADDDMVMCSGPLPTARLSQPHRSELINLALSFAGIEPNTFNIPGSLASVALLARGDRGRGL